MIERYSRATVNKGRESYCVTFRHPVAKAADGKTKLRVRRGLGTRDEAEAIRLADSLNEIIADPSLHSPAARIQAAGKYDSRVVAAFYDHLDPIAHDAWAEREQVLPLPGADSGYSKALLVGTTGSGKTTLLRQLAGTDPVEERFPSTSAAKTTTADIEIIAADDEYQAVVSFVPQEQVRLNVSDCVVAAVAGHYEHAQPAEIERRFLEHTEQRFRLNYILGAPNAPQGTDSHDDGDLDDLFDDDDDEIIGTQTPEVTDADRQGFAATMKQFLERIRELSDRLREDVEKAAVDFGVDLANARSQDREAIRDLVEEKLVQSAAFDSLVDDIMDEIEQRFEAVAQGELVRGKNNWPRVWTYKSADRKEFIRHVNRFSSNYAPNFGRLLTPIVDGIRVRGPFRPIWIDQGIPKLVWMDGQGIGHTADSSSSISTSITRRFNTADAIVLVDNAAQPMQAGSVAVLRSLVTSGHESKLFVCFTHCDDLKGDNLPAGREKKNHISGSFFNAVHAIGQQLGREAEHALQRLMGRLIFVSSIDKAVTGKGTKSELRRLSDGVISMIEPPLPVELRPVYDIANLVIAIQKASHGFHQRWRAILTTEHFTRLKALTRRLGVMNRDEYDQLRPVADLIQELQNHIHSFISQPLRWEPPVTSDDRTEEKTRVTDSIRRAVSTRIDDLAKQRMVDQKIKAWSDAFYRRGIGSAAVRARDIKGIYDAAAPIPVEMHDDEATKFLFDVRVAVAEAIKEQKGIVKGWEP